MNLKTCQLPSVALLATLEYKKWRSSTVGLAPSGPDGRSDSCGFAAFKENCFQEALFT